jgi:hypothetical protein
VSTQIGVGTKTPVPLLPFGRYIGDNSVPVPADARIQIHEGGDRKRSLHAFNLPDRSRMSCDPFLTRSMGDTVPFPGGSGRLCPGEVLPLLDFGT